MKVDAINHLTENWLIIGAASDVASNIISAVRGRDIRFFGLTSKYSQVRTTSRIKIVHFENSEEFSFIKFSAVIIISSYVPHLKKTEHEYLELEQCLINNINKLAYEKNENTRIIYFSSVSADRICTGQNKITDSSRDFILYGRHKKKMENFLSELNRSKRVNILILRLPALLYPTTKGNLFASIKASLNDRANLTLFNPHTPVTELIGLDDVTSLFRISFRGIETITFGCNGDWTFNDLADECMRRGAPLVSWKNESRPQQELDLGPLVHHLGKLPSTRETLLNYLNGG